MAFVATASSASGRRFSPSLVFWRFFAYRYSLHANGGYTVAASF